MKQGTILNKVVILILTIAIVIYLGVYTVQSLSSPFSTVLSYSYTLDDTMEATGFLVRDEIVVTGSSHIVDLVPAEGEKVSKGGTVAYLYQNSDGLARKQQLRGLELEREQLQYSLQQEDSGRNMAQLSESVIDSIVTLRASMAAGDLTTLEDETLNLKSLVYKRDFTYGGGTDTTAITESIKALDAQIQALKSQAAQDTTRVVADKPGVFSGLVDGFEGLITPDQLESYTPSQLDKLARQKPTPESGAIGKLITSARWYFICALSEEDASRLVEGHSYTARFSRDWSGEVAMRVDRIGAPEAGRMPVILSTDRYLSDTTLLRRQTVELVFDSQSGIRVPKAAIRVEEQTFTDPETEEEKTVSVTGVYTLVGAQSEFKAVTVLDQREDFCLVAPAATTTSDGAKKALRPGDEIIISSEDLFDGKVVR